MHAHCSQVVLLVSACAAVHPFFTWRPELMPSDAGGQFFSKMESEDDIKAYYMLGESEEPEEELLTSSSLDAFYAQILEDASRPPGNSFPEVYVLKSPKLEELVAPSIDIALRLKNDGYSVYGVLCTSQESSESLCNSIDQNQKSAVLIYERKVMQCVSREPGMEELPIVSFVKGICGRKDFHVPVILSSSDETYEIMFPHLDLEEEQVEQESRKGSSAVGSIPMISTGMLLISMIFILSIVYSVLVSSSVYNYGEALYTFFVYLPFAMIILTAAGAGLALYGTRGYDNSALKFMAAGIALMIADAMLVLLAQDYFLNTSVSHSAQIVLRRITFPLILSMLPSVGMDMIPVVAYVLFAIRLGGKMQRGLLIVSMLSSAAFFVYYYLTSLGVFFTYSGLGFITFSGFSFGIVYDVIFNSRMILALSQIPNVMFFLSYLMTGLSMKMRSGKPLSIAELPKRSENTEYTDY